MIRHRPTPARWRHSRRHRGASALRCIALAPLAAAVALTAEAGQRCWPAEEVARAHADQGDEVILTYGSMLREDSWTIIYRDPSDGVVTAVGIDANGMACIFDVGKTPADGGGQPPAARGPDLGAAPPPAHGRPATT